MHTVSRQEGERERLTEDRWRAKEMRELESWEKNREEGERKVLCLAHH